MRPIKEVFAAACKAHMAGDGPTAEAMYCAVIAVLPDHASAYIAMGTLYAQAGAPGRAMTFLRRGVEIDPSNWEAMANLATVYRSIEDKDTAARWYAKALEINRNPLILNGLAGCYINQGAPEKAIAYADEALAIKPDFAEAGNHRALALLEMGRYEEGWKQYDARTYLVGGVDNRSGEVGYTRSLFYPRPFTCPRWKGETVGKLAIHGEQGLGDEIMFLTCLAQLQWRAVEIAIEVNHRLVKLIQHSLPWAKVYGEHKDCPIEPDAYIPMGSLPELCWPVVPNAYLKPSASYQKSKRFRVGLSWFGGDSRTHSMLRNTLVEDWRVLLTTDNYISLQYGNRADEAKVLGVPHFAEDIADLDRLAAMIKSCDLVVSVCNTTIHMAGALGVPCLVLVPSKPAWRYGLTGDKMVWYDSVTMMRQGSGESWSDVLLRAKAWIADFRRAHFGRIQRTEPRAA